MSELNASRILIIDRDAVIRNELVQGLSHLADLQEADHAHEALSLAAYFKPNIVLLDVDLPGMSSFELCGELEQLLPDVRLVMIGSKDTPQIRQEAYLAGIDDFVAKPLCFQDLNFKVERLIKVSSDAAKLKQSLQEATEVAMMAISNSGEMGGVIDFMKRASDCHDIEALLTTLVSSCAGHFGLKVSAQIRTEAEQKTLNSEGRSSPLEAELLLNLKDSDRIFQYGHRLVINYPKVILQIKDLNLDDANFIGRIRDHIAIMVEAADHRTDGIVLEAKMAAQSKKIRESLATLADIVKQVEHDYKYQQSASHELFENLRIQFSSAIAGFGLTDMQEEDLLYMIEASSAYADKLFEAGFELDQKFAGVTKVLKELVVEDTELVTLAKSDLDDSVILF
jgi:DNA-binding NarL/FixJ family response regulator